MREDMRAMQCYLVTLDLNMLGNDGLTLTRELRRSGTLELLS